MPYTVALPDGREVEFPDSVSHEKAAEIIRQQFGQAGPKIGGMSGAFKRGAESYGSSALAGLQALIGSPEEAAAAARQRSEAIQGTYEEGASLEKLKDVYEKQGLLAAGKELAGQIPKAIAEQAPNIAASLGGAATGARLGAMAGPVGAIVGGGVGAFVPTFLPQLGGNIQRQAEEGKEVDLGKAVPAAAAQGALDVAANIIPFGRQVAGAVFGKEVKALLEKGAAKGAEKLAEESLKKTIAKGTAIGAAAEIPTEITQQMLERWQAGLPLTSDDALSEYGQTAYQVGLLAPLGIAGRALDKGAARGQIQEQQRVKDAQATAEQQRLQQEEAAKQAEFRQTPAYVNDLLTRFNEAQTKYNDLKTASEVKVDPTDLAAVDAKKAAKQEFEEYKKSDELRQIRAERQQAGPVMKQIAQQKQQEDIQKELEGMRQEQGYQATLPGIDLTETVTPPPAIEGVQTEEPFDYARQLRLLTQQLDTLKQQNLTATSMPQKIALGKQHAQIQKVIDSVAPLAEAQAQKPAPQRDVVADLIKEMKKADENGDLAKSSKIAERLSTEFNLQDVTEYKPELSKQTTLRTPAGGNVPLKELRGSETRKEFSMRRPQSFLPTEVLRDEELMLDQQRQDEEAKAAVEARRLEKVAPETVALRRMGKATTTEEFANRLAGITEQYAKPEAGSPAMGRTAQELQGKLPGPDLIHTALEEAPKPAPKVQKGPGGGFRLFNELGEPQRPSDYKNISQRLASALARPDLSTQAYNFLRRAEKVLPVFDSKMETARLLSNREGVYRDVAQTDSVLNLLDKQLANIEQGVEGKRAAPVPKQTATTKQRILGFDVEKQRDVIEGPATTAKRAEAEATDQQQLSMQAELEPLVKSLERGAEDTNAGQGELFPETAGELGLTRKTRAAFIQAERSKAVKAEKERAAEEQRQIAEANKPAAVARREAAVAAAESVRRRDEINKLYQERLEAAYNEETRGQVYEALDEAQRLAREGKEVTLSKEEQNIVNKNPNDVLGGYRSTVRRLERRIKAGETKAKEMLVAELAPLQEKVDSLQKRYLAAKGSGARDQVGAALDKARNDYDQAVERVTTQQVFWKGRQKDINDLAEAYRKADWLEEQITSGRIAAPEDRVPKEYKLRMSAEDKERLGVAKKKAEVAEAKSRAGAPATSGEALTKSQVAKRIKPEKTLYSSKGVGPITEDMDKKVERLRKEAEKAKEEKEILDYFDSIGKKLQANKELNPFEEAFIMERSKAASVKRNAKTGYDDGVSATETTTAQQDALSEGAVEAIKDGRILDALNDVAKTSKLPFMRDTAEKMSKLLERTRIFVQDDIRLDDGTPAPAAYNSRENYILIRPDAMTEANFIHEAVHAATMRALEGPQEKLSADQLAAKRELEAMFKKLTADGTLSGEYAAKNIKEFASEVQSNANLRDRMEGKKWFGSDLLRRALNGLLRLVGIKTNTEQAQDLIERLYMKSGKVAAPTAAAAQPASSIVGYEPGKLQTLKENMYGLAARVQLVDRLAAADEGIVRAEGAGKLSSMEAFNAQYFMRLADNVTQASGQFITHGPVRIVSEKTAEGTEYRYEAQQGATLTKMSEQMDLAGKAGKMSPEETERLLTVQAAGQRAQAMPNGWARLLSDNPAAAKAEFEKDNAYLAANPEVKKHIDAALKEYKTYNDGLIDFTEQCDFLSKEEADRLKKLPYVPFYRISDGDVKLFVDKEHAITIGSIADNPDLKRLLGDNQKILPILSSAVQNTFMLTRAAMKNKATLETSSALYKAGFVSKLGTTKGPANADTVHYKYKGKPAFATIDTDTFGVPAHLIVKGMEGIKTTLPALVQAMGVPANLVRRFVTRNPAYAVRQLVRDPVNAFMLSGVDGVPIVNALREMKDMKSGRSDAEEALMRGLAISSNVYSGNEDDMKMFLRDVSAGKGKWDKLMSTMDTLALQADAATRATIYRDSLAKGMTQAQAQFRAMEAQNFSRRGLSPSMQMLSTMVPFFNAQIQGLDVLYRSLTGKMPFAKRLDLQRKIKARGLLLAAGAAAYAMMMSDDEAYQKATPAERYGNFFVYLPGVEAPMKLPVPFEIGVLFMGTAQALVDTAMNDTKASEAVKGIGKLLWQSAPGVIPAGVKPLLEAAYGETQFGPIESQREKQTLQAGERYRPETTGVAKQLGAITGEVGVSPVMLEHLARGYTGSLGISILHMLDPLFGDVANKTPTPANKMPFVGGLFQTKDGRFLIDRAYERMDEVMQAKGTYESLLQKGEKARAADFANRYAGMLAQAEVAGSFKQRMGEMFADERAIQNNPDMSPPEKQDILKRIKQAENNEAKAFFEATERTTPR